MLVYKTERVKGPEYTWYFVAICLIRQTTFVTSCTQSAFCKWVYSKRIEIAPIETIFPHFRVFFFRRETSTLERVASPKSVSISLEHLIQASVMGN